MTKTKKSQKVIKMNILLKHYSFDEICEIMGYDDDSNSDVANIEMKELELKDYPAFVNKMMSAAIINGNFEEVIKHNERLPV